MGSATHEQLYDAFGAYVRSQRQLARLTLRQAAELASISNPYLSQIEHGLALPSIVVLRALAKALSVSAETMLLRAAGIPPAGRTAGGSAQTESSIRQDPRLDERQKLALLAVLASFVGSAAGSAVPGEPALVVVRSVDQQDTDQRGTNQQGTKQHTSTSTRSASAGRA